MPLFSSFAGTAPIRVSSPGAGEIAGNSLQDVCAQLARELQADAIVLGIDLGYGYRHETFRTAEDLPDNLTRLDHSALHGYACHALSLCCGLARRRETPRSRIALLRARGKPDFDDGCRKRLTFVLPFVNHAVTLACALETSRQSALGAHILLGETSDASLLLAADGRVLQATDSSRAMLETTGARVDDRLTLPDSAMQNHLEMLLRQLPRQAPGTRQYIDLPPGVRIALHAINTQPGLFVLSLSLIVEPGARTSDFSVRYGLTPCEFKLSQALASGMTLKECACRWDRSYETLRGRLKTLFSKTGCHRQSQLIALYREHTAD